MRAAGKPLRPPRCQECAHVPRLELLQIRKGQLLAEMLGQKAQQLPYVARIGLERLGRIAALGAEMLEPLLHLGREFRPDEGERLALMVLRVSVPHGAAANSPSPRRRGEVGGRRPPGEAVTIWRIH